MVYIYPAIFTPEEVEGRGVVYTVEIPDILGCVTEGDNLPDAIAMAREALAGCILALRQGNEDIPSPSDFKSITPSSPSGFVTLIDVDLNDYLKRKETKSIIKTVSLPQWLAVMAEEAGLSFSQVLQESLKDRLGL